MRKPSFKEKLSYKFDNLMGRGSISLIGILSLITVTVAIFAGLLLIIVDRRNPDLSVNIWTSIMHIIDPGTITGADINDNKGFIVLMSIATICGIFVTSILIGIITTAFEEKLHNLRKGNSKIIENGHTVILGFNPNIYTLISELIIANESEKDGCIVILADEEKEVVESMVADNIEDFKTTRVICRTGSMSDINAIKNCAIEASKAIIINSEEDFMTIKAILSVNNYLKANCEGENTPHIVSTVQKKSNYDAIQLISEGNTEIILATDAISRIIAQACRQPGISSVLIELFDYDGDELYFENFPELEGKAFGQILNSFEKAIVFGFKRGEEIFLNPDMNIPLEKDDEIILLVEDNGMAKITPYETKDVSALSECEIDEDPNDPEHLLIIGANELLPDIVVVLDSFLPKGSRIILANKYAQEEHESLSAKLENVKLKHYQCETHDRKNLEMLLENDVDNILLLNEDHCDEETSDALTLLKLIHLRDITKKSNKPYNITSQLKNILNQKLIQITKVNDLVVGSNIINLILTQISENRSLAIVFKELLEAEGSEIYIRKASEYVKLNTKMDFYTVTEILRARNEIAVGYKKQVEDTFEIITNPLKSEEIIFTKEDYIITLAED